LLLKNKLCHSAKNIIQTAIDNSPLTLTKMKNTISLLLAFTFSITMYSQQFVPMHLNGIDSLAFQPKTTGTSGTVRLNMATYKTVNADKCFFYGSSQISTDEFNSNLSGGGNFQALVLIDPRLAITLSYNLLGVNPRSVDKDSINLNGLIFPDAGSSGFMTSLMWRPFILKKNSTNKDFFKACPFFEYSMRNTKFDLTTIDTVQSSNAMTIETKRENKLSFSSLSYSLGCRFEFTHISSTDSSKLVQLGVTPYLNYFNIPDEDAGNFYQTLGLPLSNAAKSDIWSAGIKLTLSYKNWNFFADMRHNFNSQGLDIKGTPLEGFVFNIGTSVAFELFRF
jgi:hypothetical protein